MSWARSFSQVSDVTHTDTQCPTWGGHAKFHSLGTVVFMMILITKGGCEPAKGFWREEDFREQTKDLFLTSILTWKEQAAVGQASFWSWGEVPTVGRTPSDSHMVDLLLSDSGMEGSTFSKCPVQVRDEQDRDKDIMAPAFTEFLSQQRTTLSPYRERLLKNRKASEYLKIHNESLSQLTVLSVK